MPQGNFSPYKQGLNQLIHYWSVYIHIDIDIDIHTYIHTHSQVKNKICKIDCTMMHMSNRNKNIVAKRIDLNPQKCQVLVVIPCLDTVKTWEVGTT